MSPELLSDADAWSRLDAHLAWSTGSWFAFVLCDDPTAVRRLRERALRAVRGKGRPRLVRPATPQDLREVVRELVTPRKAPLTWVEALSAEEPWAEAWEDVLARLDERRERLRRSLAGGLVLAMSPALKARVRETAPDLWSIRSLVLELEPADPPAAPPADEASNAFRVRDAVLRVDYHRRTRQDAWVGLVLGDDPAPRRRVRDALLAEGLRILVHAGASEALVAPADVDLHWVVCEDDPSIALAVALAGRASRPVLVEGPLGLEDALGALVPDLVGDAAFVARLHAGKALHPGADPPPDGASERVRDAGDDVARARELEGQLPVLRGPDEARARTDRVEALARAVEALLVQGWSTEAQPVADELLAAADGLRRGELAARARALELAGRVAQQGRDAALARERFEAALPLRRTLARTRGPDRVRRRAELARCLSVLGELAAPVDPAAAEGPIREALALRRRLARLTDDLETLTELATAWSLLGDLLQRRHEPGDEHLEGATEAFREALRLRELVAARHRSPRFQRLLSVACGKLGQALARGGDKAGAHGLLARGRELALAVSAADPGNVAWRSEASVASTRLGDAARALGDIDEALAAYREGVEIRARLVADDPENARWQELQAVALARLADVLLERGELDEAARTAARAVASSEQLVWLDPSHATWRRRLASALLRQGDVQRARGRTARAREAWGRALACAEALAELDTDDARRKATEVRQALEARGVVVDTS